MKIELLPIVCEIEKWLLFTTQHTFRVEYFLQKLGLGNNDPERPHDIVGEGNKFQWDVLRGMALQYRNPSKSFFKENVKPSLLIHRKQYHHRMWNEPNLFATAEAMKLGAVDAICSHLEDRLYQGGAKPYDAIATIKGKCSSHEPWLREMVSEMRKIEQPAVERITSINKIVNIGVSPEICDAICERIRETKRMLRQEHGYEI